MPIGRHEAPEMPHSVIHRLENFLGPTFLALMTWLSRMPMLQVFGLVISAGWLILGVARERRQWLERSDRKASGK